MTEGEDSGLYLLSSVVMCTVMRNVCLGVMLFTVKSNNVSLVCFFIRLFGFVAESNFFNSSVCTRYMVLHLV